MAVNMTGPNMTGPGLPPPPGIIPNFIDPYSRKDVIEATIALCLALCTSFIALRIYTKVAIVRSILLEDFIIALTGLLFIAYCIIGFIVTHNGLGTHQWNVQLARVIRFGQWSVVAEAVTCSLDLLFKTAILLLYTRIFVPVKNKTYYLAHFVIWFNALFNVALMLAFVFQCTPRRKIWMGYMVHGHCINYGVMLVTAGIISAITDFHIFALPVITIWRLQLPVRKKTGISMVFAVGLFACVASVMRIVSAVQNMHSKDLTYDLLGIYLWSIAEIASGIICCCLPVIPQFLHGFKSSVLPIRNPYARKSFTKLHVTKPSSYVATVQAGVSYPKTSFEPSKVRYASNTPAFVQGRAYSESRNALTENEEDLEMSGIRIQKAFGIESSEVSGPK